MPKPKPFTDDERADMLRLAGYLPKRRPDYPPEYFKILEVVIGHPNCTFEVVAFSLNMTIGDILKVCQKMVMTKTGVCEALIKLPASKNSAEPSIEPTEAGVKYFKQQLRKQ